MHPTCTEPECSSPARARGYCKRHHKRAMRLGIITKSTPPSPRERFTAKTTPGPTVHPDLGPCLDWTASTNEDGYGEFWLDGKSPGAHRVVWEWANGPVPAGTEIDHRCSRRICVRLSHLRAVTKKQNAEHRSGPNAGSSSKYQGVTWRESRGKWEVQVTHDGRCHYGGEFANEDEAGTAARLLRLRLHTHSDGR